MAIDLESEDLIELRTAAKMSVFRNHKTGRPAHVASIFRYVQSGARSADGTRVRLEIVRTPGGMKTSKEAVWRFIERLTNGDGETASIRTTKRRERDIAAAEAELAAVGI